MKSFRTWVVAGFFVASLATAASSSQAQQLPIPEQEPAPGAEDYGYYRPVREKTTEPTIAQQKAMARAQQRMARLDAMRWYGFSGGRPTASGLPWTTMYSPAWQQPGGRPFAWYMSSRPTVIYVQPSTPVYR